MPPGWPLIVDEAGKAAPAIPRRSWFARHKVLTALAGVVVVLTALTAVGALLPSGEEPANLELSTFDKARVAITIAPSVHINGRVPTTRGDTAEYDVQVSDHNGVATLTQDGVPLEFIRVDTFLYVKGSSDFWKAQRGAAAATLMNGKYLKVPISDPRFAEWAGYFNPALLIPQRPEGATRTGGTKVVNGVNTLALIDPDPQNGGTLYIATDDPDRGRPIRLEDSGGRTSFDFTYPREPVKVAVPPSDQVIDLARFERLPQ
jgi:hypothetical protein